jgi:hypothetical protein
VIFFHRLAFFLFKSILVVAQIRVSFLFPAHEVSSPETTRDDIIVDSPVPADVVFSGFCTDLAVAGSCAPFSL